MSNIVQFIRKDSQQSPSALTPDDEDALRLYDFRGEWERTTALVKSPADMQEILDHCILLNEISEGICVSELLKNDHDSSVKLCHILESLVKGGHSYITLQDLKGYSQELIGYVWTYDFQVIVNARVVVSYLFPEDDEELVRTVYFPNNA